MEAEDELHSELKKARHVCAITICQHSGRGGSDDLFMAVGLEAGEQREEGQPVHTGQPTHASGQAAKFRLRAHSRIDGCYSPARQVPFRDVDVVVCFNCAASCMWLFDVVSAVSRSLHRLATCLCAAIVAVRSLYLRPTSALP